MTNLTKILIGAGIVGTGVIATPMIYNNQINKFIAQEKIELQKQQIELKETKNSDSFLNAKREYIVTIKDITPIAKQLYPQIDFNTLNNLKETFDNTQFLVILNIIKFPVYHKDAVKIDLYSLNDKVEKEMSNNEGAKQILEAIKNRAFEAILDINNLKVSKAKLKDIDLTLKDNNDYANEITNIKIVNAFLNVENDNNLKIDKISINSKRVDKEDNFKSLTNIEIDKIDEKTKKQDLLNSSSELKISSINYSQKSKYVNFKLNVNNILNLNSLKTITNKTSMNNKLNIKNISLNDDSNDTLKIDNFKYNFNILNLDTPSLKTIMEISQNSANINPTIFSQNVEKLVQKGFKISISPLSVDKVEANFDNEKYDIKPIEINLDTTISKNNFTLNSDPQNLLGKIDAKLKVTTEKENIDLVNKIAPQMSFFLAPLLKEVNNKILINIEYQNGKITSNGKQIF